MFNPESSDTGGLAGADPVVGSEAIEPAGGGTGAGAVASRALKLVKRPDFVTSPFIERICERAGRYLDCGVPVHLCGPPGSGKTTLAYHIAARIGQPVVLIHGDDEHGTSDLVGRIDGYQRTRVTDNFIHSVMKSEESCRNLWSDDRLTTACRRGYTLIYDEFTRSRPEANNVLLGVLGERILDLPRAHGGGTYLRVHSGFRAVFTSNPEEYAGIHSTQDALLDRMVTLELDGYDPETEIRILEARTGLDSGACREVIRTAREVSRIQGLRHRSILRGALMLAQVLARTGAQASAGDPVFLEACIDVFGSQAGRQARRNGGGGREAVRALLMGGGSSGPAGEKAPRSPKRKTRSGGRR